MPAIGKRTNAAISGPTIPPAVFASVSQPAVDASIPATFRFSAAPSRTNATPDSTVVEDVRTMDDQRMRYHSAAQRPPLSTRKPAYDPMTVQAAAHITGAT